MELHAVKTWVDRREGVVEVDDDVLGVVADLKQISDRLHVYWNDQSEWFDIVESCLDGTDRLVTTVPALDARVVEKIKAADHWHGNDRPRVILGDDEDFVAQVDSHNEEMERLRSEATADQIGDAGERLAWALDICKDQSSAGGSISVPRGV